MDDPTINVIEEVLSPSAESTDVLPSPLATGDEIAACAKEAQEASALVADPRLSVEQRRSFGAQFRPNQAAATAICVRMLGRSPAVATRAGLAPDVVTNLLAFDAGLGAVRQVTWPLMRYGRMRFRMTAEAIDHTLQDIDANITVEQKQVIDVVLGQTEDTQAIEDRTTGRKTARTQKRNLVGQTTVTHGKQGVSMKHAAENLVSDVVAGKTRARLPAPEVPPVPTTKKKKTKAKAKAKAKTTPTPTPTKPKKKTTTHKAGPKTGTKHKGGA